MPYIKKEKFLGKSKEARQRQLDNLNLGRRKGAIKTKESSPKLNPFSPVYKNDIIRYLEDQYYIPETRQPVILESWQKKDIFKPLFYTLTPEGLRQYSLALISTPKKNSKSTMASMVANYFLFQGEDFGEIIVTSNSRDQSSWIVFDKLKKSLLMNPYQYREAEITDDFIRIKKTGTVARIIAPNYRTASGSNPSLTIFDELWAYDRQLSYKFWDELTESPARKQPLALVVSYAGFEEEGLLWDLYQRGMKGKSKDYFFYWTNSNPASWVTKKYLRNQRNKPGMRANTFLRLHENRWVSSESSFIDIQDWDGCVHQEHHSLLPGDRSKNIYLGVDIGISHDCCAVVGTYRERSQVKLAFYRLWKPTRKQPIDLEAVEDYIKGLKSNFSIREVRYDPYQFHRSAQALRAEGLRMVEYPQTTDRLTSMSQNLYDLIKDGNLVLYRDKDFRDHAQKATAKEGQRGWRIVKKKSSYKIDLIISLAMSCQGTVESPADSGQRPRWIEGASREHLSVRDYESPITGKTWGVGSPRELLSRNTEDLVDGVYRREKIGLDRPVERQAIPDE